MGNNGNMGITFEERFWSKVDKKGEDECWEWIGARHHKRGYGQFLYYDRVVSAHIVSYIIAYGNVINGLDVCHKCDNVACVNPNHLFLAIHFNNMWDMVSKGRAKRSGITKELAKIIKIDYYENKLTQFQIHKKYGLSTGTICYIINNKINFKKE